MKDQPLSIPPEKTTLYYHRKHPEGSLERYVRSKMLATADRVLARKVVYLDTPFWILLRDVTLGRRKTPCIQIVGQLHELIGAGKMIWPINADTLAELLKQSDPTTRLATTKLIDELSLGAALQSAEERVRTDAGRTSYETRPAVRIHDLFDASITNKRMSQLQLTMPARMRSAQ